MRLICTHASSNQWSQQFWSFKVCNCLVYFAQDNSMKPGGVNALLVHKSVARFLRARQVKVHQCPLRVKSTALLRDGGWLMMSQGPFLILCCCLQVMIQSLNVDSSHFSNNGCSWRWGLSKWDAVKICVLNSFIMWIFVDIMLNWLEETMR